jgi:ferrous iron transport protein A
VKPHQGSIDAVPPAARPRDVRISSNAAPTRDDARPLDTLATGLAARVVAVSCPATAPDWGRWLADIGFLPGEQVTVTARSPWGGDPLVVRVGQSTFALRRTEAACVHVAPLAT